VVLNDSKGDARHNSLTESHAALKPVALGADVDSFNHRVGALCFIRD
jgi:hypothetical protein